MGKINLRRASLVLAGVSLTSLVAPVASAAYAQEAAQRSFDIPAQDMASALEAFGRQSGKEILYDRPQVAGKRSTAVSGSMEPADALNRMVKGSGLSISRPNPDTFLVQAAAEDLQARQHSEAAQDGEGQIIQVTGSRLRVGRDNRTSPLKVITREDIENQGLSTAADIIDSIPQNFSATNDANTTSTPGLATTPRGALGVAAANLFGLGSNATLVLVNGHRLAGSPSFQNNGTIDLSTIPAEAIERVEIVMDGASAIYGSDAVGGVINFILRSDYSGASISARADHAANDGDTWKIAGTLGTSWSTGSILATAEYRHADALNTRKAGWTTSDLTSRGGTDWRDQLFTVPGNVFFYGALPPTFDGTENWTAADLSPANLVPYDTAANQDGSPRSKSYAATVNFTQEIGSRVKLKLDSFYSREKNTAAQGSFRAFLVVPATNPFNHLGETAFVLTYIPTENETFSDVRRISVHGGFEVDLFKDWKLDLTSTYGKETSRFTVSLLDPSIGDTENVFGNGTAIGDVSSYIDTFTNKNSTNTMSYDAFVDGTLFNLPGGPVKLGVGAQRRHEEFHRSVALPGTGGRTNFDQTSSAAFFEASVPLVGKDNRISGVESLQLSLAGRYDRYKFEGRFRGDDSPVEQRHYDQFSPRIGVLYRPAEPVKIRASWGKSFRAPPVMDLGRPIAVSTVSTQVQDPETGNLVSALFGTTGNSDLQPETSTTQSYGIEWAPRDSGLTLGLTYSRFNWKDRIQVVRAGDPSIWPFLDQFPALIPRDLPVSLGGDGDPTTIDAALNGPVNIANRKVNILNATAEYKWKVENVGDFNAAFSGVFTLKADDVIIPGSPAIKNLGRSQGPDRVVLFANLGWNRANYGLNLYGHFSSSYKNTFNELFVGSPNTGRTHVKSWTTFDLTGFYNFKGLKVTAGVKDILGRSFPFYDSAGGPYDPSRVDPRGRTFFLELRNEFKF